MKKQLFCFFVAIVLLLTGCGTKSSVKWLPELASDAVTPYAQQAIKIIDGYLAFESNWEETQKSFEDLFYRIEQLEIIDNGNYSKPDQDIALCIRDLFAGQKTDMEYYHCRDTIAFYIGVPASGKIYEAERNILNSDNDPKAITEFSKFVDIESVPFSDGSTDYCADVRSISLSFDQKNGVKVSDLQDYIDNIWARFDEMNSEDVSIYVSYRCYGQDVFSLLISTTIPDSSFSGIVLRTDAAFEKVYADYQKKYAMEDQNLHLKENKYPKEFEIVGSHILCEFDSIEKLPQAITAASEFAETE